MELKLLNTRIQALAKKNAAVEAEIQELGLACIEHIEEHGDTMPLNRLINALRRGQHQAFMTWVLAFAKVKRNMDKATKEQQPVCFDKSRTTDIDGATAKEWFTFADSKADGVQKAFDLQAAMMAVLKRAAAAGTEDSVLQAMAAAVGIDKARIPAKPVDVSTVAAAPM
jgi:hypothetical protein